MKIMVMVSLSGLVGCFSDSTKNSFVEMTKKTISNNSLIISEQ